MGPVTGIESGSRPAAGGRAADTSVVGGVGTTVVSTGGVFESPGSEVGGAAESAGRSGVVDVHPAVRREDAEGGGTEHEGIFRRPMDGPERGTAAVAGDRVVRIGNRGMVKVKNQSMARTEWIGANRRAWA